MLNADRCLWYGIVRIILLFVAFCGSQGAALHLRQKDRGKLHMHGCHASMPQDLPEVRGIVDTVIIILGGPTRGLEPGPWLEWRLKAAMKLYGRHDPNTTAFLLTGGRPKSYGSCGAYSEAAVMQRWLENAGITRGIWREDRSNNTLDNAQLSFRRLRDLESRSELAPAVSVHVITQSWHMVKASECFRVFFRKGRVQAFFDSVAEIADDTMVPFEQESYSEMYRVQLRNWLPWQLGFNRALHGHSSETSDLINSYVSSSVAAGQNNDFFLDGVAAAARDSELGTSPPSCAWSRINDMQWRMFARTLSDETAGNEFVVRNSFSRWGSLGRGLLPRYVTAFNPQRDSGDLLGLSCPDACGRRYRALRVVAFLHHPESQSSQRKVFELAEAWSETHDRFSPQNVALYVLKHDEVGPVSLADAAHRLSMWNTSALSKSLDTDALQALATH